MKSVAPSLADLLARIAHLEQRTSQAEERATRAEARADRLENATGNIAAAVINPKAISRRKLLMKAAGVGIAGVAGNLLINRPKEALAVFTWQGGATITADAPTNVNAAAGFVSGSPVLQLQADGAIDGSSAGIGLFSFGAGQGYGIFAVGGRGTVATPRVNGGAGIYVYGGPGATAAAVVYGDAYGDNNAIQADALRAFGNGLGVGGVFRGGRAQVQLIPNGGAGAPTSGPHSRGDLYLDNNHVLWVCISTGTPGIFRPLQPGGMNSALFTAVSTQQYPLNNSDGVTWTPMDPTNLKLTITPTFNCQAWVNAGADLWTATSGFNQDIGIAVIGTAYPTVAGQPEAWKESGGSAGTFSPNAAHVDTIVPLAAGVTYTIQLVWKTNHSGTSMIAAGAGPIGGKYSPTRLTAWLVPTNPGGI